MDKPRRNSAGSSAGRGSDKKNTSPSARGAAGRGKSDGKFEKKPFDKDSKKTYGKSEKPAGRAYGDKPAGKSYGDKPTGRTYGDKPAGKSYGDKPSGKVYGDKPAGKSYGDKPSGKTYGDKPAGKSYGDKASGKTYGDKPAGKSFGSKSAYGKTEKPAYSKKSAPKDAGNDRKTDRSGKTAKPRFESEGRGFNDEKNTFRKTETSAGKGKKEGFLDDSKKRGSKPRVKKESAPKFSEKDEMGFPQAGIRLNKFIANSGLCSRREADVMITNGVVTVNGKMMDELGYRVQQDDVVKFDGRTIIPEKPVYLLLNKPKDYITTSEDPQGRRTVMALIQGACKERLFPVGRLDRNTTGLLLFTNDGEMADKLMHPRKRVKKIYSIELDKNVKHEHLLELREGITLEDGPIKPDEVEYTDDKRTIGVEIHSGRNRIVRRMFEHFGYKVVKLDRVYYAGLTKKNLPRGHYRMLEPLEVNMLKML